MAAVPVLERNLRNEIEKEREYETNARDNDVNAATAYSPASAPAYQAEEKACAYNNNAEPAVKRAEYAAYTAQRLQQFSDSVSSPRMVEFAPAVKTEPKEEPKQKLFEDYVMKGGVLVNTALEERVQDNAATIEAPAREPEVKPQPAPAAPERVWAPQYDPSYTPTEEDSMPSRQTMETLNRLRREEMERNVGFFASLSLKTKVALCVITAVIVLMIALVCVNTAIINSLNANIATRQEEIVRLAQEAEEIENEISEVTDSDYIAEWAISQGMER